MKGWNGMPIGRPVAQPENHEQQSHNGTHSICGNDRRAISNYVFVL
jgi:hypothetical protein